MSSFVKIIDLFCGVGGLTYGLQRAGLDVLAGIDNDESCEYAYTQNNHGSSFLTADIATVSAGDLRALYPAGSIKVLVGCAPCQPFSKHAHKNRERRNDGKYSLLNEFARLVSELEPGIISMENVPQLRTEAIFTDFVGALEQLAYTVSFQVVYCPSYGIPQSRSRLVLLASKHGEIELIPPTHSEDAYVTVRKTIGMLPAIAAGESDPEDPLHRSAALSPKNLIRIRSSVPGGSWRDWDPSLVLECHKKPTGTTYGSVYSRMQWDEVSPTMTTQFYAFGTGRFGHPEQNRALSLREGALLQTFPPDYQFIRPGDNVSTSVLGRHIGNAVPVKLGEVIGQSILLHCQEHNLLSNENSPQP